MPFGLTYALVATTTWLERLMLRFSDGIPVYFRSENETTMHTYFSSNTVRWFQQVFVEGCLLKEP